jgi:16S rRNA (cytidine1402-2'-O)-methyltransferase
LQVRVLHRLHYLMTRTLYLLPAPLGEITSYHYPDQYRILANAAVLFIAENAKSARACLKALLDYPIQQARIEEIGTSYDEEPLIRLLESVQDGESVLLLSDAGCPAVADPGGRIILAAHGQDYRVVPLPGPSSIILALMASGLNGQGFTFHGYLPAKPAERKAALSRIESESRESGYTQIFIEAPYRNDAIIADMVTMLKPQTMLTIAAGITTTDESIHTRSIAEWKRGLPALKDVPAVFLLLARK